VLKKSTAVATFFVQAGAADDHGNVDTGKAINACSAQAGLAMQRLLE
jgi:hypothetical protein